MQASGERDRRSSRVTVTRKGSWILLLTALLIVAAWPPDKDRSLVVRALNWLVDPADSLPVLPPQLGFGLSDDPQAVELRDEMVRRYDELFNRDALTRTRLELKVAQDPFNATTERQLLLAFGIVVAFAVIKR